MPHKRAVACKAVDPADEQASRTICLENRTKLWARSDDRLSRMIQEPPAITLRQQQQQQTRCASSPAADENDSPSQVCGTSYCSPPACSPEQLLEYEAEQLEADREGAQWTEWQCEIEKLQTVAVRESTHCEQQLRGHTSGVRCLAVACRSLLSGSADKTIRVWDLDSWQCTAVLEGHRRGVSCLAVRGEVLFSGSDDQSICVWSTEVMECTQVLKGHTESVSCLALSELHLISGSHDMSVRLWDLGSWQCAHVLLLSATTLGHAGWITCLSVSHHQLITGSDDETICVWLLNDGLRLARSLKGHTASVECFAMHRRRLISGSADCTIRVWDLDVYRCLYVLPGHSSTVTSLVFSGDFVFSGSLDNIFCWNTESWRCVRVLHRDQCPSHVTCMAVTGRRLTASVDKLIKVWV